MVPLLSLWLPIVLSAVAVFILSSLVWMVLPWHRQDFRALPDEPAARAALRSATPGQYMVPYCSDRSQMQHPDHLKKMEEGPVGILVMMPKGNPSMSRSLVQWFVWTLVVSTTVAYVLSNAVPPDFGFVRPFQLGSTAAWMAYSWAYVSEGIWFGRPWSHVVKQVVDGLLYALATGAIFGWLYP